MRNLLTTVLASGSFFLAGFSPDVARGAGLASSSAFHLDPPGDPSDPPASPERELVDAGAPTSTPLTASGKLTGSITITLFNQHGETISGVEAGVVPTWTGCGYSLRNSPARPVYRAMSERDAVKKWDERSATRGDLELERKVTAQLLRRPDSVNLVRIEEAASGPHLISVMVDHDEIAKRVRAPDGSRLTRSDFEVVGAVAPARAASSDDPDAWRRIPISVVVAKTGYERLSFSFTIGTKVAMHHLFEGGPRVVSNEPFGPMPGVEPHAWAEIERAVTVYYLQSPSRKRARLAKEVLHEAGLDAIPAMINAVRGLDISDATDFVNAGRLVLAIQEVSHDLVRIPFEIDSAEMEEHAEKNQRVLQSLVAWWAKKAADPEKLCRFRENVAKRAARFP